ncbi:hypothetical protein [Tropicimonas aquimaris]|uniref:Uncharacterized protein n=1 Tax=Tropicimonas aquimaris TaxID=914152 RepID=A0ABW3IZ50_9RHOB
MLEQQDIDPAKADFAKNVEQSAWASARAANRLDSEMAAHLRMHLAKVFLTALNWTDLEAALRERGFYLEPYPSNMWLCDRYSHVRICSCSFLGQPSAQLEVRLGTRPN